MFGLTKQWFVVGIFGVALTAVFWPTAFAKADILGDSNNFYLESSYDIQKREQTTAVLRFVSDQAYFYVEHEWYKALPAAQKELLDKIFASLALEFDNNIYPKLTSAFGSEWKPGIDNDNRVTIFFHQFKEGGAGYMRTRDEVQRQQAPGSNEREMIYINADFLFKEVVKSLIAHELTHLIEYNQKERNMAVNQETWFSEFLAESGATVAGYDNSFPGSNLQRRLRSFVESPSDSLTEWKNEPADYGVVSMFAYYWVDHFSRQTLTDAMLSKKTGLVALEEALNKNGVSKSFSQVFADFVTAVFLNDCSVSPDYCFRNSGLARLKISPSLILLPASQKTEFALDYSATYWAGNWYRVMGGDNSNLTVRFQGDSQASFRVPYVLCSKNNQCSVKELELNSFRNGQLQIDNFGQTASSLVLMPIVVSKTSGFDGKEPVFSFSLLAKTEPALATSSALVASTTPTFTLPIAQTLAQKQALLKAQIADIQKQIASLQKQLLALSQNQPSCSVIAVSLKLKSRGSVVRCLQEFLRQQGSAIYSEGLITGYFGELTELAVKRFQEKYQAEILAPAGLTKATGVVGPQTRAKINQLLIK